MSYEQQAVFIVVVSFGFPLIGFIIGETVGRLIAKLIMNKFGNKIADKLHVEEGKEGQILDGEIHRSAIRIVSVKGITRIITIITTATGIEVAFLSIMFLRIFV